MKLKNRTILSLLALTIILFSSCNKEEAKLVNVQYNYSNLHSYTIYSNNIESSNEDLSTQFNASNISPKGSDKTFLSVGLQYSRDDVKIVQMKISNSLYNWSFTPKRIEDGDSVYYGQNSLLIPNNVMPDDFFDINVYYSDGSVTSNKIETIDTPIEPLNLNLSIYKDYLLINLNSNQVIKEIDESSAIMFDSIDDEDDASYMIQIYKDDEILSEKLIKLNNSITLYKSSSFVEVNKILIEKKIDNKISANLYYINKLNSSSDSDI